MKTLNSLVDMRKAAWTTGAGMLLAFLLLTPVFASATSYTLTVGTDKTIYNVGSNITISGTVSPTPPAGSYVTISVTDPNGILTGHLSAAVGATGSYSYSANDTSVVSNTGGTYTIKALWAANVTGPAYTQTATFTLNSTTGTTTSGSGTTTTVFFNATTTVVQE